MKTSKIIFISLLGAIAFFILAGFLDIRFRGVKDYLDPQTQRYTIAPFKVLLVSSSRVRFVQKDSTYIDFRSAKDTLAQLNYTFKNDTLTISDPRSLIHGDFIITLHTNISPDRIILKDSEFQVEQLKDLAMTLDMDKSHVWLNQDKSFLKSMNIEARNNSHVNAVRFQVDTLRINLRNSNAILQITSHVIEGNITESSRLNFGQSNDIRLKKIVPAKLF